MSSSSENQPMRSCEAGSGGVAGEGWPAHSDQFTGSWPGALAAGFFSTVAGRLRTATMPASVWQRGCAGRL
eukprot:685059-Lingulodinium_polyedra.AAC.1